MRGRVKRAQAGFTCWPIAQTKPESSRAMATTILLRFTPRAARRRKRAHSRSCAFQARSVTLLASAVCRRAMI
jgi:hypothetical protein